jgi:hypothetical protein
MAGSELEDLQLYTTVVQLNYITFWPDYVCRSGVLVSFTLGNWMNNIFQNCFTKLLLNINDCDFFFFFLISMIKSL